LDQAGLLLTRAHPIDASTRRAEGGAALLRAGKLRSRDDRSRGDIAENPASPGLQGDQPVDHCIGRAEQALGGSQRPTNSARDPGRWTRSDARGHALACRARRGGDPISAHRARCKSKAVGTTPFLRPPTRSPAAPTGAAALPT
jgi:hypothetical protein